MPWPVLAPPPAAPVARGEPPSFSVVIPVHEGAAFVAGAIDSALAQTVAPRDVVVCDDGSTDDLSGALAPFAGRIVVVRQSHLGPGAARNAGAAASTGDFVALLDADDRWDPRRIEALTELAVARPDLDILTTDAWFEVDGERRGRFGDDNEFPTVDQRATVLERAFLVNPAVRRRRWDEVGGFDTLLRAGEDHDFLLRLVLAGSVAGLVDAPLATYWLRPGSLADDRLAALRARLTVLDRAARNPHLRPEELPALRRARARHERRARVAELDAALSNGRASDVRAAASAVARTAGVPAATRTKAALAVVAPRLAARMADRDSRTPARPRTRA